MTWTLHHGDALALLPDIPPGTVDLLCADPPYASGGLHRGDRVKSPAVKYAPRHDYLDFSGDQKDQRAWMQWMTHWLTLAQPSLAPGAHVLIFTDWRQLPATTDAVQWADLLWRGIIAWDKGLGARAPHTGYVRHQCEYLVWATNGDLGHADGRGPFPGCYHVPVDPREKAHRTGKPIALLRQLVRMAPPDGLVLDPFAGSGSTGIGALLEGRRFVGFERDAAIADSAQARLARFATATTMLRKDSP